MSFKPVLTTGDFQQAVKLGTTPESKSLEFKAKYGWNEEGKAEQAVEVCRDVAQFANTDGGSLLIGVSEKKVPDGRKVADAIVPVTDSDGLTNWIEQAIRNNRRAIQAVDTPQGAILAVNVWPSIDLVSLWHKNLKDGIEYLFRTDYGKQWMNPDEVEMHLMAGPRAKRLLIQEVVEQGDASRPLALVPPVHEQYIERFVSGGSREMQVPAADERVFLSNARSIARSIELKLSDGVCVVVPLGFVREAWVTANGSIGICLDVVLVRYLDKRVALEPLAR
jgi:hypothetical protein